MWRHEAAQGDDVDRILDEPDAAVAIEKVRPARVERGDLVVVAGIIALGDVGPAGPIEKLVIGAILVIGRAGDAEALVGLGPAPVAAIGRIAAGRTGIVGIDQCHGGCASGDAVPVTLEIRTEVSGVAAGVLGDGDRVACAVGDLGDAGLALLQQSIGAGGLVAERSGGSRADRADVPIGLMST